MKTFVFFKTPYFGLQLQEWKHTKCLAYKSHVCPVTLGDMQYRTRMCAEHEYKQQNVLHAFIPDWYDISVYSALIMGQVLGGKKERDFLF